MATSPALDLFNCCPGGMEPDWSRFDALIIGGCCNQSEDDDHTEVTGGQSATDAEFFTVYGRLLGSVELEAIADFDDPRCALSSAGSLAIRSELQVIVDPTLGEAPINLFDAVTKARRQIQVGDVVTVVGGFGREFPEEVTVDDVGDEFGRPTIGYRDGRGRPRWAYQTQILED